MGSVGYIWSPWVALLFRVRSTLPCFKHKGREKEPWKVFDLSLVLPALGFLLGPHLNYL